MPLSMPYSQLTRHTQPYLRAYAAREHRAHPEPQDLSPSEAEALLLEWTWVKSTHPRARLQRTPFCYF